MRFLRPLAGILLVCLLFQPAAAQSPPVTSTAEIDATIRSLEDPAQRARLVEQLKALRQAQAKAEEPAPTATTVLSRTFGKLSEGIAQVSSDIGAAATALRDLPRISAWVRHQLRDPDLLAEWVELLWKLAVVLAAGAAAELMVARATRHPRDRLDQRSDAPPLRWLVIGLRVLLRLLPIAAFIAAAYLALAVVEPNELTRLLTLAVVNASVLVRAVLAAARAVLARRDSGATGRVSRETQAYAYVWVRRLATVAVYGFFLLQAALLVGMPAPVHGALMRVLGLVLVTMLAVLILQNRQPVADAIRRLGRGRDRGAVAMLRRRLADVWHILAILYVVAAYLIWALGVRGGFDYLMRATGLTLVVVLVARLASALIHHLVERGFTVGHDLKDRLPGLELRANRYLPVLHGVLQAAIWLVASVVLLQVWGANSFAWFASDLGRRITGSVLSIGIILAVAAIAWEVLSSVILRYLTETDANGIPLPRSARVRTLLPLLRNALAVFMIVVLTLIILSEIGVDIAPLLAGAGVVGLAIGFGSQALVKDVITGLFMLLEDTINVGDVVRVGDRGGSVEAITIRTIRLRDSDGSLHTIPFSTVDAVQNMTRGFGQYVFKVSVDYRTDIDHVMAVLRRIDEELRADPAFRDLILEPIDIWGVDQFGDNAVVVAARTKTLPGKQWSVGRAFNKRMKERFDAEGIVMPFPQRAVQIIDPRTGQSPEPPDSDRKPPEAKPAPPELPIPAPVPRRA